MSVESKGLHAQNCVCRNLPCLCTVMLKDLHSLQELEKLNPQVDPEFKKQFLANFDWTDSTLNPTEITQIEELLVERYRHE